MRLLVLIIKVTSLQKQNIVKNAPQIEYQPWYSQSEPTS